MSLQIITEILSTVSMLCWVCSIVPQFVINCINQKRSELSPYLFLYWLLGDLLNLTGSILTNQLPFQIVSCVFFVMMDILSISQYIHFSRVRVSPAVFLLVNPVEAFMIPDDPNEGHYINNERTNDIGLFCGTLAGIMYIFSRITQLIKIRKTKSVENLLMSMFIFAIGGNMTYILTLFLKNAAMNALPWIICSFIVMILDFIILYHFYEYQ